MYLGCICMWLASTCSYIIVPCCSSSPFHLQLLRRVSQLKMDCLFVPSFVSFVLLPPFSWRCILRESATNAGEVTVCYHYTWVQPDIHSTCWCFVVPYGMLGGEFGRLADEWGGPPNQIPLIQNSFSLYCGARDKMQLFSHRWCILDIRIYYLWFSSRVKPQKYRSSKGHGKYVWLCSERMGAVRQVRLSLTGDHSSNTWCPLHFVDVITWCKVRERQPHHAHDIENCCHYRVDTYVCAMHLLGIPRLGKLFQ